MSNFTFVDLFSGVGGFRQAMSSLGGKCVFASEMNLSCTIKFKEREEDRSETDREDVAHVRRR